ncbi:DUF4388 domain-containing protein [Thermopolyspora sp. NPDC052614]|uniref:DUF4388 domain-containing protein n=1 Tax=Thermopolyspora sp. NPDC052614 TaxID=3155682 RepID=UPI003439C0C5
MSSADYGTRPGRPETGGETRILDELHVLAAGRASGALRIDGDPGGVVYLDGGRLVFAEAAGVPDLGARLVGSRWVSPEEWQALRRVERAPGGLGELLVERGLVGRDDMLAVLRSASLDAITALTVPVAGRPSVTGVWFASRERSWAGSMLALEIEAVRTEMTRRARLMAGVDVPLDALPVGADLRRPYGVLNRDQWLVASRVDGVTPLRDLVWRNGLALYDTVESVDGLVREGLFVLLAPDRAGEGEQAPGTTPRVPGPPGTRTALPEQADTGEDPPWAAAPILAAPTHPGSPTTSGSVMDPDVSSPHVRDDMYADDAGHPAIPRRSDAPWGTPPPAPMPTPTPSPAPPPMPRRRPGASIWDRVQTDMRDAGLPQELSQTARTAFAAATPELLRRLLDGLRELDEDDPPSR